MALQIPPEALTWAPMYFMTQLYWSVLLNYLPLLG